MRQIATKISDAAHDRLQRLAHQNKTNFATIIEQAIMAYQPLTSETIDTSNDLQSLIEAALEPVLARVAALESLGLVKPLSPEHGVVVSVEASHQGGDLSADDHAGVVEVVADRIASEIAPGAAVDAIERAASLATPPADYPDVSESKPVAESPSSPILPDSTPNQRKPTIKEFIANLVSSGERSPTKIARALNEAGYRTLTGKEFTKGNQQITDALNKVKGK